MKIVAIILGVIILLFVLLGMAALELLLIMVFAPGEIENNNNFTE